MTADENLESLLKRQTRFAKLVHTDTCESTQDLAGQPNSASGQPSEDAVFWSDHQTSGRGRQDRIWADEAGLDLAVTLRITTRLPHPLALPAALPVAVLQACEPLSGTRLRIKWPNDVYADDRKLSGVLIDRDTARPNTYRIGVGINVNRTTFGSELEQIGTSLRMLSGRPHDRHELVGQLAICVHTMVTAIERDQLDTYIELFRERLGLLGKRVEVRAQEWRTGALTSIDFENVVLDDHVRIPLATVRSLQKVD